MKHTQNKNLFKIIIVFVGLISITLIVGLVFKQNKKKEQSNEGSVEGFKSIEDAFADAFDPKKNGVASGFEKAGKDIKGGFDEMGDFFKKIQRFFDWIGEIFTAIGDSVACVFVKIGLLPRCSKWYFFDFIGKLIYSPFAFLFWFTSLQYIEDIVWDTVNSIDEMIHDMMGIHVAHFPEDVVTDCYKFCDVYYPPWPF